MSGQNPLYPIFLKLDRLPVLIVGGGETGLEKISILLKNSPEAKVTILATDIKDEIKELVSSFPNVNLIERPFKSADLEGKRILILATANIQYDAAIVELAKKKNILCNVADKPALCDFYLGSIVSRGDLKIAISTNGKSPTMAKRLREFLEDALPNDTQAILDNLGAIRDSITGDLKAKIKALNEATSSMIEKRRSPK